ncbi:MAG: DUF3574 domain-containing protein [Parvibaculum sp.]|uniref:DUF3574 domain-containing protein n=1 Tax=Parvibaculum sp. TaxID=2024848 RepID=UPI002ABB588E|nr:DUF3574 domain-containing protein [Parvibaculum sp.]MDZ4382376.1 DUF3574 domain-containing protein [Parvibaculum sp.]
MRHFLFMVGLVVALIGSGDAFAGTADAVETTLYFGLDLPGGGTVSEEQWSGFLADAVTPRFPDGFTVLDGYGQWRDPGMADAPIVREKTRVIVIVHPETSAAEGAIGEIKSFYKTSFGQKSVFHTQAQVRVVE